MGLKIKNNIYIMKEGIKKKIINNEDDGYESEQENYLKDEDEGKIEEEYFTETVNMVQKNLLDFVENKSLPLCEYLNISSIKKFININIKY